MVKITVVLWLPVNHVCTDIKFIKIIKMVAQKSGLFLRRARQPKQEHFTMIQDSHFVGSLEASTLQGNSAKQNFSEQQGLIMVMSGFFSNNDTQ